MFDKDILIHMASDDQFNRLLEYVEHSDSRKTIIASMSRKVHVVVILNATDDKPYYTLSPAFVSKKEALSWFNDAVKECRDIGFASGLAEYRTEQEHNYFKVTCDWSGRFVEYRVHSLEIVKHD